MSLLPPSEVTALQVLLTQLAQAPRTARPKRIDTKSVQDFVTDMDMALEDQLREEVERLFPGIAVIGEESIQDGEYLPPLAFLVDPLDGTGNWIAGLPLCGISVALVENGETIFSAVADIYGNRVYGAKAGAGAWLDGERLVQQEVAHPLMALSTGILDRTHVAPEVFYALRELGKLRNLGSQALQLCLVADGSLGLNASIEARLWDDAAGRLIVMESGGIYCSGVSAAEASIASKAQHSIAAHPTVARRAQDIFKKISGMPSAIELHQLEDNRP